MREAFLLCQLFFCDLEGECEKMREFLKSYPTIQAAEMRRDQYHRSNLHPWIVSQSRIVRWECEVKEAER